MNQLKWLDFRVIRMLLRCEKRKKSICMRVFNLNEKQFILEAHCIIRSNSFMERKCFFYTNLSLKEILRKD